MVDDIFNYVGSIQLLQVDNSCVRDVVCDDGVSRQGIFLPFGDGCVKKKTKNITLDFYAYPIKNPKIGNSHMIIPKWSTERFFAQKALGFRPSSIGSMSVQLPYSRVAEQNKQNDHLQNKYMNIKDL